MSVSPVRGASVFRCPTGEVRPSVAQALFRRSVSRLALSPSAKKLNEVKRVWCVLRPIMASLRALAPRPIGPIGQIGPTSDSRPCKLQTANCKLCL